MSTVGSLTRKSLVGGTSWLAASQAFSTVCALGTTIIWTRLMTPELFGEFRVLTGILAFVAALCLLGTGQASMMSAAKNMDGNLRVLLRMKVSANVLAGVALVVVAGYYAWAPSGSRSIAFALLAVALLFPIFNASDIWTAWINGQSRIRELAISRALTAALAAAAILASAVADISQLWLVALIYWGAASIQSLAMILIVKGRLANRAVDPSIVAFGHHSSLAMAFSGLLALDVVVLNHAYTPHDVAIYAVALQFPELLKRMFSVLDSTISPMIYAAKDLAEMWREIRTYFLLVTAGCIAIGVFGFYLLPPATVWLFSERYLEAADYGRWLWLIVACCGSTTLLAPAMLSTKNPFFIYVPYIGYPISLALLLLFFVSSGVAGLIMARMIAVVLLASFYVLGFIYCLRRVPSQTMRG